MSNMNILDFAKRLEQTENNGVPMWRHTWCIGADHRPDNQKHYLNEFPSWGPEQINHGVDSKSGNSKHPGRGFTEPPWFARKTEGGDKAYRCCSIYLKQVPDLFVVDLDERDKCNQDNPVFQMLLESGTPYTETTKGYHFYTYIKGTPDFTNGLKCQKVIDPIDASDENDTGKIGDMDLIGRKYNSASNIIEAEHNPLHNGDAPIVVYEWEDFSSKYLNVASLMGATKTKKDKVSKEEQREATAISGNSAVDSKISLELFTAYLDKLEKSQKRYCYNKWLGVGIMCHNNFEAGDEGFALWMRWSHEDPLYKKLEGGEPNEHSYRNIAKLQEKWEGFKTGLEVEDQLTWKTLRSWANEDSGKTRNVYQETYDARGYAGLMDLMNSQLAFNNATSEVIFLDPLDNSCYAEPRIKKMGDMTDQYSCYQITCVEEWEEDDENAKKKRKNPFTIWKNHPARRNVCGITFDPSPGAPKNYFNLFQGFEINREDVADLSLAEAQIECSGLLNHIRTIWCKNNEEHYNFVMSWFAHILQKPHIKVGCLVCVKSKEGAGKGIVFDFMRTILGNRLYAQISDINELVGNYNSVLEGRLLINGDEVVWGGNIQHGNKLKGLITEPEVRITEKYRVAHNIKNTTAFCMSSNEDRCCSAREGDRRSFGLELDNTWAGRQKTPEHTAYFQNISGTKSSSQGTCPKKAEAFAKVLFEWDLSNFNPKNPPLTEFVSGQIMKNWHSVEKWWYRVLSTGTFAIDEKYKKKKSEVVPNGDFEKTIWHEYDNRQLHYGNVSEEYGNGIKDGKVLYTKMDTPCYAYAYWYSEQWNETDVNIYPCGRATSNSRSIGRLWKKFCEKHSIDFSIVPIPLDFQRVWHDIEDNSIQHDLTGAHRGKLYDGPCRQWDDPDEDEYSKLTGMTKTWTQPNGLYPTIRKSENVGTANPMGERLFTRNSSSMRLDLQMPMDNGNGSQWISVQERMERSAEAGKRCGEYDRFFNHTPTHYYRLGMEDCFCRPNDGNWDIELAEGKEEKLAEYLAKWGDGVKHSNFHEDLAGTPLFSTGDQLFHHEQKLKIKRWVYEKDWVFEKFEQQVGSAYGSDNVDYRQFWGMIEDMLGGRKEDGRGGLYRSRRLTNSKDDRRQYWQFVSLDKAREKFCEWAGRLVNWDDDDTEDLEDHSAYGY